MDEEAESVEEEVDDFMDGEITLSSDELSNILKDAEPIEAEEVEPVVEMEEVEEPSIEEGEEGENRAGFETSIDNVDELLEDEEIDISDEEISDYIDNLGEEEIGEEEEKVEAKKPESVDIESIKKVLSYLDELLGNLPDDVIEKFAKSEYFDMYEKILEELGIVSEAE